MSIATLSARDVAIAYRAGRAPAVEALRNVSFDLAPGKVLGLVGESGAGKSMIGRAIAGRLPPGFAVSRGALTFAGDDLVGMPAKQRRALLGDRISFIPQEPLTALNPVQTIARQFGEHLARLGVPARARRARMIEALAAVRLAEPASVLARFPFQLSGGMCQRVLIAMAFASDPALVVADEPTTALDVSTQATIVSLIRAMQARHATAILFITHDLRLASRVCDDVVILYAGEPVEWGPAATVLAAPRHPYARALKAANPALTGPLRRLVSLPDRMPALAAFNALPACRFAPRCPVADTACAAAPPLLGDARHGARCADVCAAAPLQADGLPHGVPADFGAPVLDLVQLGKTFAGARRWFGGRRRGSEAVKAVDLSVRAGEFVGIVGESGSGKSTLARLIMGLETPSTGRIAVDGRDIATARGEARAIRLDALQMIFQDPQSALNPRRSVGRLVTQAMEAPRHRAASAERAARAGALLTETGLPPELVEAFPAQLSGGQKQRVNIARALCVTPRLLVADEIVSGLDVSIQAQILNLLLDLRDERGIGLLLISHDLAVVRYLCSRVLVMQHGAVVESGPVSRVFGDPQHPYTRSLLAAVPPDDPAVPWP